MPIPTSRTKENATIYIHDALCTGCALCVEVCKDFSLKIENHKVVQSEIPLFGCFGCGQCMAICPHDAIKIEGRYILDSDLFDLPKKSEATPYLELINLLHRRRSIRDFKDKPVEKALIQQVIAAASSAPMGLPPSDVHLLVMENKEKVNAFARDFCDCLEGMKWFVSGWFLSIMRPFWRKSTYSMFHDFLKPLIETYTGNMKKGKNVVTYDAPAAIYFYGTSYSDPADPVIAATYAMIAAESLGLATCMIGGVHPFIQKGRDAKKFRQKQNIRFKSKEGLILVMGYPKFKFQKGIRRSFANVDFAN